MGNGITAEKEKQFQKEKVTTIKLIHDKYAMLEHRKVLIIGGPHSGKTQLFRNLIGRTFMEEYTADETAQFGFKVMSTIKSEYAHLAPLSYQICCAPGSILRNDHRASDYYFKSPEIILICIDFSHLIEEEKIQNITNFILRSVQKHHDFHTQSAEAVPPYFCHIFTKKDKAQLAVVERNNTIVRQMVKNGHIENYLYVSAKTNEGMTDLKEAMFNCNIKEEIITPIQTKDTLAKMTAKLTLAKGKSAMPPIKAKVNLADISYTNSI